MSTPKKTRPRKAKWQRVPVNKPMSITELAEIAGVSYSLVYKKITQDRKRVPFPWNHTVTKSGNLYIITRKPEPQYKEPGLREGELDWTK